MIFMWRKISLPWLIVRQLANTGAYLFPREVFNTEPKLSARGEYEITDYVSDLAARQPVTVVQASFWLPIGTVDVWQQAQTMDLAKHLERAR